MLHVLSFLAIGIRQGFRAVRPHAVVTTCTAAPFRSIVRGLQTRCARADLDVNFKIVLLDRVCHCDAVGIHRNQTTDVI